MTRGDQQAFNEFFEHYYSRVYRYLCRRLNEADAEEVAMITIEQAIRRIETYRAEASLLTWVYHVARSQLSAFLQKEQRHAHEDLVTELGDIRHDVESIMMDTTNAPEAISEQAQRNQHVQLLLDYLPSQYGQVLEWKYVEGLSVEEIAGLLETSVTAIQSMLARARKAFKEAYDNKLTTNNVVSIRTSGVQT